MLKNILIISIACLLAFGCEYKVEDTEEYKAGYKLGQSEAFADIAERKAYFYTTGRRSSLLNVNSSNGLTNKTIAACIVTAAEKGRADGYNSTINSWLDNNNMPENNHKSYLDWICGENVEVLGKWDIYNSRQINNGWDDPISKLKIYQEKTKLSHVKTKDIFINTLVFEREGRKHPVYPHSQVDLHSIELLKNRPAKDVIGVIVSYKFSDSTIRKGLLIFDSNEMCMLNYKKIEEADTYSPLFERKVLEDSLTWLRIKQNKIGYWPRGANPDNINDRTLSSTAMAIVAFISNSIGPLQDEHNNVTKAIQWLIAQVDLKSGLVNTGTKADKTFVYENAIACYSLAETFRFTLIVKIESLMNAMVKAIIDAQRNDGTWALHYEKEKGLSNLSASVWQVFALKAAYSAGCEVEGLEEALLKARHAFKELINTDAEAFNNPSDKSFVLACSVAHCLQLLSDPHNSGVIRVIDELKKRLSRNEGDFLNWERGTQVRRAALSDWYIYDMYMAHSLILYHGDIDLWKSWVKHTRYNEIALSQKTITASNLKNAGYWDFGEENESALITILNTLIMTHPRANLNFHTRGKCLPKPTKDTKAEDLSDNLEL